MLLLVSYPTTSFWFSPCALKPVHHLTHPPTPDGHRHWLLGTLICVIKFFCWWAESLNFASSWTGRLANMIWRWEIVDRFLHPLTGIFPSQVAWLGAVAVSSGLLVKVFLSGNPLRVSPPHSGNSVWSYPCPEGGQWKEGEGNGEQILETWLSKGLIRLATQTMVWGWITFVLLSGGLLEMQNLSPTPGLLNHKLHLNKAFRYTGVNTKVWEAPQQVSPLVISYVLSAVGLSLTRPSAPTTCPAPEVPLFLRFWHVLNIFNNFTVRDLSSIILYFFTDSSHLNYETSIMSIQFIFHHQRLLMSLKQMLTSPDFGFLIWTVQGWAVPQHGFQPSLLDSMMGLKESELQSWAALWKSSSLTTFSPHLAARNPR